MNMKKIIYFILIACSAILFSCKDDSGMAKDGDIVLSNLTAEPRIGAVLLKWDNPSASDYYYATVTYINSSGEEVRQKVSVYSVDSKKGEGHTSARIGGFSDTKTYEFTVTPYTTDGRYGDAMTVSCAPEDASKAYKYIGETAEVTPTVEGAVINWINDYGVPVTVNISYKTLSGETKTVTKKSSESGTVEIFPFVEKTSVTITATDESGKNTSEPTVIEVTPERGEIPHSRMAVIGTSSVDGTNTPERLLDDDVKTAWKSKTEELQWAAIDLGDVHKVNWIELVGDSKDKAAQPTSIQVFYSKEPVADISQAPCLGTFEYNPDHVYNHAYEFKESVEARYILVAFQNAKRVSITEFLAYYADAANHYEKEAAIELNGDSDDDPTYYPDIEYMVPKADNPKIKDMKVSADNPDDPSEFTCVTTGSDPYIEMTALKKQAAGTVVVFQYKSTADLECEFFWCIGGWRPAGGKETKFNIKKTDEWTTFTMNMVEAWDKGWWTGAPGDLVRLDVGAAAGETVSFRLMRWREAEEGE